MLKFALPLIAFFLLALLLGAGLTINPREVPSAYIGKAAPGFDLPHLFLAEERVSGKDLLGKVWVLNVWASWCVSCRAEHEVVSRFAQTTGVDVVGLNYKDEPADAKAWLQRFGNPYSKVAVDYEGRTGIDWGVFGVPESFVVDSKGIVRHKFTGPIDDNALQNVLIPLIEQLRSEAA